MPVCVVKLCKNNTTRNKKDTGITYHQFPGDPVWANDWINVVRKSRNDECWKPVQRTVICSNHFHKRDQYTTKQGTRRIRRGAIPSKALFLSGVEMESTDSSDVDSSVTPQYNPTPTVIRSSQFDETTVEKEITCGSEDCTHLSVKTNDSHKTEAEISQDQTDEIEDFSDLESIFDSPDMAQMRKELRRKIALQDKHTRIIKGLRMQNLRLKNKIVSLKQKIKNLEKKT